MRNLCIAVVLLALPASALAAPGDTWILPIDHRDGGGWTEYPGAGYGGSSAWGAVTSDTRRIYWALNQPGIPATTELYTIEFWAPRQGGTQWQPIESRINGAAGDDVWGISPSIPWAGLYGVNHQWIGSDGANDATWHATGPGPHTPNSPAYNAEGAAPDSIYMWLKAGSWLYAKWDFAGPTDRSWSALRITQITPEPGSALVLLLGGAAMVLRRNQ